MTAPCTVACAQLALDVADPAATRERTCTAIADAFHSGANIIVVPELANSGYAFHDLHEARRAAEDTDGPTLRTWAQLAHDFSGVVIGGFAEQADDEALHNSVAIVTEDGVAGIYRKIHLWDRENDWFHPGSAMPPVVATRFGAVSTAVCYDVYFPEFTRAIALSGAELLAVPTNAPRRVPGSTTATPASGGFPTPIQLAIYATMAHQNGIYVAACDRAGEERGIEWIGASGVFSPDGWMLATPPAGYGTGTLFAQCRLADSRNKQRGNRNDLFADRRPEVYDHTTTKGTTHGR
ncbi:nitrilase-related carbon-nitrogen hydrolase [Mycobacterium aquaticum]|uniref:CN hydrolase domain-containing protein n=1 Tax=Mycobacterium aquaticum TaxID=1927124 RepID=A0A1X0BBN0_9MYCO|nr:nitrilase-related carbon-nitrogen hydrolase [Mycobacterium aquaticum]ORA39236.1 hypothetical protein BST13_02940 [Mycobacterium aquaticum]